MDYGRSVPQPVCYTSPRVKGWDGGNFFGNVDDRTSLEKRVVLEFFASLKAEQYWNYPAFQDEVQ